MPRMACSALVLAILIARTGNAAAPGVAGGLPKSGLLEQAQKELLELGVILKKTNLTSIRYSWDGTRIITGDMAGEAAIWDAGTGEKIDSFKHPQGYIRDALLSADDRTLIAWGLNDFSVWDTQSRNLLGNFKIRMEDAAAPAADGLTVYAAPVWNARNPRVKAWDLESGKGKVLLKKRAPAVGAALNADGSRLFWVVNKRAISVVRIYAVERGKVLELIQETPLENYRLNVARFSPDGSRVLLHSGIVSQVYTVWDTRRWERVATLEQTDDHLFPLQCVAFSPDASKIGITRWDRSGPTVAVWDARSGRKLDTLRGHQGPVTGVSFNQDATKMITLADDGTARKWREDKLTGYWSPDVSAEEAQAAYGRLSRQIGEKPAVEPSGGPRKESADEVFKLW